ncbi:hypothetical protein [Streptomyces sp. MA15]|uniref:hypothetical protein n=1 Tax=Streptomyces sp. MA15 TaxID=3055061 RepID=UPI0025B13431|nr:hypothetical protein [Streptomyces sp. MA15]MDN3267429.1 hypothetical protein [Streptomyces sp. MA15]
MTGLHREGGRREEGGQEREAEQDGRVRATRLGDLLAGPRGRAAAGGEAAEYRQGPAAAPAASVAVHTPV